MGRSYVRACAALIGATPFLFGADLAAENKYDPAQAGVSRETPTPHKLLERLIGDWDTGPADAPPAFVQRLSWGTDRAYVIFRTMLLTDAGERLHFEGPILWNAATGRFDYLFAVEPASGTLAQEKGEIYLSAEDVVIRDVTLTGADGSTARFRQTFRVADEDRIETSLMRETNGAWSPTFPGSERLIMTRRR